MDEKRPLNSDQPPVQPNGVEERQPPVTPSKKRPRRRSSRLFITLLVIVLLGAGAGYGGNALYNYLQNRDNSTLNTAERDGNSVVTDTERSIADVVEKVSPSVVSITTEVQSASFRGTTTQAGAGTGIIVSANGYVMTNNHVIDGAQNVEVVATDGTRYENVRVVGSDPLNDIAFLKIDKVTDLTAAEIGNSSSIRIGQSVVAIGNALGQYQNTVTSGIISGTGRPVVAQSGDQLESLTDLLQTDAAINSGNSGGPLLNMSGQVIGINTAVANDANGIGFAIPIDATKGLLEGLLETGEVTKAYLGVNYVAITPDTVETYDLPVTRGAYIFTEDGSAVVTNSPAEKAGIENKDIITKVGDKEVGNPAGVASLIGQYQPGDTVALTVLRGDRTLTVQVTLEAYSPTSSGG